MVTPKPTPPTTKSETKQQEQAKKASFKLKKHLTHRPFSDETLFAQMRKMAENNNDTREEGTK